ncbi:MAG: hypothetical protein ACJ8C4_13380 [Gemmataceae bacterium]
MNCQPDLFLPMCARVSTTQIELFDQREAPDTDRQCVECGNTLTRTPSGYLCCPRGHGRLILTEEN